MDHAPPGGSKEDDQGSDCEAHGGSKLTLSYASVVCVTRTLSVCPSVKSAPSEMSRQDRQVQGKDSSMTSRCKIMRHSLRLNRIRVSRGGLLIECVSSSTCTHAYVHMPSGVCTYEHHTFFPKSSDSDKTYYKLLSTTIVAQDHFRESFVRKGFSRRARQAVQNYKCSTLVPAW